ncbi:MAG TPA: DUF1385 domain-containing protein [Anaerolineae bacterium]|nr:DUF1385 domain-containing protein [Anaerolineae bacterium]
MCWLRYTFGYSAQVAAQPKSSEFHYGGQAVIEGVMIRGQKNMAVAVRDPAGKIVVHTEPLTAGIYTSSISKWPLVRGLIMLWDTLVLGIRTLMFSADVALGEEEVEFSGPIAWGTITISLIAAVSIFFLGPLFLIGVVDRFIASPLLSNIFEGLIRLALFLAYVFAIGFIPDIKRVFAYHGAEHKTINAYEDGASLEPTVVGAYTTAHSRCGTAFLLTVVVIAVLVFAFLGRPPLLLRVLSRLLLIPVIAALAYEYIKFSAAHGNNPLISLMLKPGLALQRLTTREPDETMLEVAITALERVLAADEATETTD